MNLELLDIIILAIIAIAAVSGIIKGFVRQIVSIAALILGTWCAFRFSGYLSVELKRWTGFDFSTDTLHIIMFIIIFLIVLLLANLAGKAIREVVHFSLLGWLDRLLGFVFGALKVIVIMSIAVYFADNLNRSWKIVPQKTLESSRSYVSLQKFHKTIFPFMKNILS